MTETTATTGTSPDEVEAGSAADDHAASGAKTAGRPEDTASEGAPRAEASADAQAVGRASVPSTEAGGGAPAGGLRLSPELSGADRPTFTRPPGMPEPPMSLAEDDSEPPTRRITAGVAVPAGGIRVSPSGAYPLVTAPASGPPRASGVTVRPISGAATGTAKVGEAPARPASSARGPRRARLGIKRIDPWSVMKFSFAVSLVLFIVLVVAASVLYLALDSMGVFASVNNTLADLLESGGTSGGAFQITARLVIGTAAVFGAINVVLFTALATLSAFIYNVCADLVGGVEVTLAERD